MTLTGIVASEAADSPAVELRRGDQVVTRTSRIQQAIDQAQPGDTIRLGAGIYHEVVSIHNKVATAKNPYTLEGPAEGEAILDGADEALQQGGNGRWKQLPKETIWEATVPWSGREARALLTWASTADERLIAAHHDEATFRAHPRGDALWRVGTRVWLRLADGRDPNTMPLNIGRSEAVIDFKQSAGWVVRGLTIRHAGFAGILLGPGVESVRIEKVAVQTAYRGISTEEYFGNVPPKRITIDRCRVFNNWDFNWDWKQGYADSLSSSSDDAAPMRGGGIHLMADDSEITNCEVSGQWDGMQVQGRNLHIHHNVIHDTNDDMIEMESNSTSDLRFHDNLGFHLFAGISLVSDKPGPIYIYRNRVQCDRKIKFKGTDRRAGYPLKFGHDWGPGARKIYIYQNTFDSVGRTMFVKTTKPVMDKWYDMEWVNNICNRRGGSVVGIEGMGAPEAGMVWEGNLFSTEEELKRLVTLNPVFASAGIVGKPELSGINAVPPVLEISESSAARGAGSLRARKMNWPDSLTITAEKPDVGAQQYGTPLEPVGPGGSLYHPWSDTEATP